MEKLDDLEDDVYSAESCNTGAYRRLHFDTAFAVVQVLGIWDKAINIFIPLLGVMNLCQAYLYWNEDRKVAVFSLVAAVFILICAAAVFLL